MESLLQPVRRTDLVQEVVGRLREQILAGTFASVGTIPPEGQLGQSLGVSRTVIREAMRILAAQGLVEVSRGKLPRVKPADPGHVFECITTFLRRADHSLADLVEVRRPLESAIAALAAKRATPVQIDSLEEANRQLIAAQTLDEQIDADMRFHTRLAEATGNPIFGLLLEPLTHLLRQSLRETLSRSGVARAADGHELILEAVRRSDSDDASRAMLELLAMAEKDLRDTIQ
jgi:GntR family transcriptional regulator, transcriptional repressor for pyruvate dehydrogenase complex